MLAARSVIGVVGSVRQAVPVLALLRGDPPPVVAARARVDHLRGLPLGCGAGKTNYIFKSERHNAVVADLTERKKPIPHTRETFNAKRIRLAQEGFLSFVIIHYLG